MNTLNQLNRRQMLQRAGMGIGSLGLASLLQQEGYGAAKNPLAAKQPHFKTKAKSVIWLFINGGPSHVDTWDYKPELAKRDGQALEGFDRFTGFFANAVGGLMKSPFEFKPHGQSGKHVSSIFPNLSKHVDKMAFIHSGHTESNNHSPALFAMNCGLPRMGYPCVGSWVTYGLGSESDSLPAFVVMSDPKGRGLPKGHAANWGAGFLPSVYQGTHFRPTGDPIDNLKRPAGMNSDQQRRQLDLLKTLNQQHFEANPFEESLAARIESFELAYRMQSAAPEALAVDKEPEHIRAMYGLDDDKCKHVAAQCLTARRMVERGVRFIQIYSGMENQRSWDGHNDIAGNHSQFAGETDKPIAALLQDLPSAACWMRHLSFGAGNSVPPVAQKSKKPVAITIRTRSPTGCGGGGKAACAGETDEIGHVPPSTNATSTTSTPPSSTCWAWITRNSPIATTAATSA